jgi:hypothetical protein
MKPRFSQTNKARLMVGNFGVYFNGRSKVLPSVEMPRMLAKKTIAVDSALPLKLSIKRNEENLVTLSRRASGEAAARAMKDLFTAVSVVLISD